MLARVETNPLRLFDENMQKPTSSASDVTGLTPLEQSNTLYADWADKYDSYFAQDQGYALPQLAALAFVQAGGRGPVLDAGAGTGLCGVALTGFGVGPIDAVDLSPEMLAQAVRKDIYRDLIEADLLDGVPMPRGHYRGVISTGLFTHGHIGPDGLPALLRVAASGAQFALTINEAFYESAGFSTAFDRLLFGKWIEDLTLPRVRIYGDQADADHRHDTALIALFKKT